MMSKTSNMYRLVFSAAFLLLSYNAAVAQKPAKAFVDAEELSASSTETQIKLKDGSTITVAEASESEQGIWYRIGGVSHLITRDRVKSVQRGSNVKNGAVQQQAKLVEPQPETQASSDGPAWIYLKGGARVEADSATESVAGVWYRRGSLTIFVDHSRIDHVERETLESLAESASSSRKERGWTTGNSRIDSLIRHNGARYGVDPYLIFCVMEQESHFNARALSPKGARGLMQLMPGTAARFGVTKASDPAQNIAGGTRYLKQLLGQFDGRIDLVLASYNAGEGAVMKYGGRVPPYRETRNYVKRISYRYRQAKPIAKVKNDKDQNGGL
jgi:hypothetical protein